MEGSGDDLRHLLAGLWVPVPAGAAPLMAAPGMSALPGRCWVLTEGIAGTENQCLGLAEAMGAVPVVKRAKPMAPWRHISPAWLVPPLRALEEGSDPLAPPWPDLLIAGGRKAVGLALRLRRKARCFTIFVQNPRVAPSRFDLVIAPRHDRVEAPNAIATRTALHRVTQARLADARERFGPRLAHLPRPLVAVLLGGASRRHHLGVSAAAALGRRLAALAADNGASLAVTASRRTPRASFEALAAALGDAPAALWRGEGENPYFGYLACADAILVTADSVSMTSEACAAGKPVYVAPVLGRGSRRFERFFSGLEEDGLIAPFNGRIDDWSPRPPVDETAEAARLAVARFRAWAAIGKRGAS